MRKYLLDNTTILEYLDLTEVKVFSRATVDTNILSFQKSKNQNYKFDYMCVKDKIIDEKDFIKKDVSILGEEGFLFSDEKTLKLRDKIESKGVSLKSWDISINRGILTGYNDAFIIDTDTKDKILASCKDQAEKDRTKDIFKFMLQGKDVGKYGYKWADKWLINTHNGYTHNNIKVPKIDINLYPSLKAYLDTHYQALEKRSDKGDTPYNLRSCAYVGDFEKEKIIYPCIMAKEPRFVYDNAKFYAPAPANIIVGEPKNIKYLCGLLNSNLIYFAMRKFYMGGGIEGELKTNNLEKIPIPQVNSSNQKIASEITKNVETILSYKQQDKDTSDLEARIDKLVYELYDLDEKEIEMIENFTKISQKN